MMLVVVVVVVVPTGQVMETTLINAEYDSILMPHLNQVQTQTLRKMNLYKHDHDPFHKATTKFLEN